MDVHKKKVKKLPTTKNTCPNPCCFFCLMKQPTSSIRSERIAKCFEEIPLIDDQEHVLVLSGLWNISMTQPDDPEFPSLGIFKCMASLIRRGLTDKNWLLKDQNIYIPYYAAHIIGSYTMNKVEFAKKAVDSGVILPLVELLRGKMSWVEQRVAVRALGHLASYETTFEALETYEEELVNLAMDLASTCVEVVYVKFVGVKDKSKRVKYHCDLLTRGIGGVEMENKKAEEWASQLQCWSLYLLNSFAIKERSIGLMCKKEFLRDLCEMWGGLVNHTSPGGIGLIRILCHSQIGREKISESQEVVEKLCHLSRSSDDWQYVGIDCLRLFLNDPNTRYKVMAISTLCLVDLVEIRKLGGKLNVGEAITRALLVDFRRRESKITDDRVRKSLEEIWDLKVERKRKERNLGNEKVEEKRLLVRLVKQEGNHSFWAGKIEEALLKYTQALDLCPIRLRKERIVLYSNRSQCHLLLSDPDAAISDTTRALSLSVPVNSHTKSLWRRSQAYDMKGLAKESLMDCLMFINVCFRSRQEKIPYYAARMITKQMELCWLFSAARSKRSSDHGVEVQRSDGDGGQSDCEMMRMGIDNKGFMSGLSTILEEPLIRKSGSNSRKVERTRERKNAVLAM